MAVDPVISFGATSTITWTMDEGTGYVLHDTDPGGQFIVKNGGIYVVERPTAGTLLGNNPTQVASAWSVNDNDADAVDGLQTIAGDTIDGGPAWDTTAVDNAAFKMRGNATAGDIAANEAVRGSVVPSQWQVHTWRMYANSAGNSKIGWVGVWTNSSTPQLGILFDPSDATLPNHFILASEGVSAWPDFNREESTGVTRSPDGWMYVMWAGRTYTVGATSYYDRVIVVNSSVVKSDLFDTTIYSPPTGARFGCIMDGDFNDDPSYFDSYRVWEGVRYPIVTIVQFPDARPASINSISSYTVSTLTSGVDRGGAVFIQYQLSSDGGQTFGATSDISNITTELFAGNGDDVIRLSAVMISSSNNPATGVQGLFAPVVNQVELTFVPAWREQAATAATWTEVG